MNLRGHSNIKVLSQCQQGCLNGFDAGFVPHIEDAFNIGRRDVEAARQFGLLDPLREHLVVQQHLAHHQRRKSDRSLSAPGL